MPRDMLEEEDVVVVANPVKDLLLKAADLIEQRGLAKHQFEDRDGALCINGAIMMGRQGVANHFVLWDDVMLKAAGAVKKEVLFVSGGKFEGDPAFWNNDSARTKQEVIDVLRAAAAKI